MDNKTLAYELAKKYTFEKFDFKNGTPEELLKFYQETENKIYNILNNQSADSSNIHLNDYLNFMKDKF